MNREDMIRMAREAGFQCLLPSEHTAATGCIYDSGDEEITPLLQRFAILIIKNLKPSLQTEFEIMFMEGASAEREACAKVADTISEKYGWGHYGNEVDTADEIATAIRARGRDAS
jgi:hypothetical protein